MELKTVKIFYIILIVLIGVVFSNRVSAETKDFNVKVFPKNGAPMLIKNFKWHKYNSFYATWRGSLVTLLFKDIKEIRFTDEKYNAIVIMNDGTKDNLNFGRSDDYTVSGKSGFGKWYMEIKQITKIEFNPSTTTQTQTEDVSGEFDQILLKNGDIISGQVKTDTFKLRTSYGTLSFETPKISYIDFEGGGQNVDVVVLKIGDKLSGVIEVPHIKILMRSGTEVPLDKEKIKKITFKK